MRLKNIGVVCSASFLLISCGQQQADRESASASTQTGVGPRQIGESILASGSDPKPAPGTLPKLTDVMLEDYFKLRPPKRGKARVQKSPAPEELQNTSLTSETFTHIDELVDSQMKQRGERRDPEEMKKQILRTGAGGVYGNAMDESFSNMMERLTLFGAANPGIDTNELRKKFEERFALIRGTNESARPANNPFRRSAQEVANEKLVREHLDRLLGTPRDGSTSSGGKDAGSSGFELMGGNRSGRSIADMIAAATNSATGRRQKKEEQARAKLQAALKGLQSDDPSGRARACGDLPEGDWGEHGAEITSRLVWMVRQTNLMEQIGAVSALGKSKPLSNEGRAALLEVAKGTSRLKSHAALALYSAAPDDAEVNALLMTDPQFSKFYEQMQKAKLMIKAMQPAQPPSSRRDR